MVSQKPCAGRKPKRALPAWIAGPICVSRAHRRRHDAGDHEAAEAPEETQEEERAADEFGESRGPRRGRPASDPD